MDFDRQFENIQKWRESCIKMNKQIEMMLRIFEEGNNSPQLFNDMKKIHILTKLMKNPSLYEKIERHIMHSQSDSHSMGSSPDTSSPFGHSMFGRRRRLQGEDIDHIRLLMGHESHHGRKRISADDEQKIDPKHKDAFNAKMSSAYDTIKQKSIIPKFIMCEE